MPPNKPTKTKKNIAEEHQEMEEIDPRPKKKVKSEDTQGIKYFVKKSYYSRFTEKNFVKAKVISFNELDQDIYKPNQADEIFMLPQTKNIAIVKEIMSNEKNYPINKKPIYLRGPSGNGKSFSLIRATFEMRQKHHDKFRILHIILNEDYAANPYESLWKDFYYCFVFDLESGDFPDPPTIHPNKTLIENWESFFTDSPEKDNFLKDISLYFESKGIKLVLIWDQDNAFHKVMKKPSTSLRIIEFLKELRSSNHFHVKIISASNNNEGFESLPADAIVYYLNTGFDLEECKTFIKFLKKLKKIDFDIDEQKIFDWTNGNCYLINRFMQADGSNFDEKYENFSKEMQEKIEAKIEGFFIKKFNEDPLYKILFHNILNYLDIKDMQIPKNIEIYSDKNYTYIENDYLKSVNNLSKKVFLNYTCLKLICENRYF